MTKYCTLVTLHQHFADLHIKFDIIGILIALITIMTLKLTIILSIAEKLD